MKLVNGRTASLKLNGQEAALPAGDWQRDEVQTRRVGELTVKVTRRYHTENFFETWVDVANESDRRSGQITGLTGLDAELSVSGTLDWDSIRGDSIGPKAFLPQRREVPDGETLTFESWKGRSSQEKTFPYFDLTDGDRTVIFGVGWTGNWRYTLRRDGDRVRVCIGVTDCDLYLEPGESIRSALVTVYLGDAGDGLITAHQKYIRTVRAVWSPEFEGETPMIFAPTCFDRYFWKIPEWRGEKMQLQCVEAAKKCDCMDAFWVDASWFREGFPNGVGNYDFTPELPNGLVKIAEETHRMGRRLILWFEPERVQRGSDVFRDHPDWLLGRKEIAPDDWNANSFLFNLGNDEAREWLLKTLCRIIAENGVDIYRQDCNINPLFWWRDGDLPGKAGYTENRYVLGLYRLWDDLKKVFPKLLIDNCASGGRRLDPEMNRRSVSLWRSDNGCEPCSDKHPSDIFNQCQTMGLSRYMPYHQTGVWETEANFVRSAATGGLTFNYAYLDETLDYDVINRAVREVSGLRRFWNGDFTPLTEVTTEADVWAAFELSLEDEGFALFFRRSDCEEATRTFALAMLDPSAAYEITLTDEQYRETKKICSGSELTGGFAVTIPGKRESLLLKYRKISGNA